jgi:geranylgeranylglycerol-phosphate geranylgeranyltransferase
MKADTIKAFLQLVRADYSLFGATGILVSGILSGDLKGLQPEYLVAYLIAFLTALGSFAFNDYRDLEIDVRNERKDRPLVSDKVPAKMALIAGLISFVSVFLLSFFLNWTAMFLVLVNFPLFFLYSLGAKKVLVVKNCLIAWAYVSTILLGSVVTDGEVEPLIMYFASMGFIVGMAFEIMLDIADREGDESLGVRTIPTEFGVRIAAYVSVVLFIVIMVMDPLPFFVLIDQKLYGDHVFLLLILVPVFSYMLVSRLLVKDQSRDNIFKLKKRVYLTMLIGCFAYLVGVVL